MPSVHSQQPAKMAVTASPNSVNAREKCFLCEVPRGPWAMLHDFSEPVCRACCNYEGIDHISEVIDKATRLRRSFENFQTAASAEKRSPHETVSVGVTRPNVSVRQAGPTYAHAVIPQMQSGKVQVEASRDVATSKQGFTIPGISQPNCSIARMQPISVAAVPSSTSIPAFAIHPKPIHITDTISTTTQKIQDTLSDSGANAVETDTHVFASNTESEDIGMDESSFPYTEPSQEVGHKEPSALVTGAAAVDPEVKEVYHFLKLAFIIALMAILLKSANT